MSFLTKITGRFSDLLLEALVKPIEDLTENLGFIFGSLNPADWIVRFFVTAGNSLAVSIQLVSNIPFKIASEIALEASEKLVNKKLRSKVMTCNSAMQMVFRLGAEKFIEAASWQAPPMIKFGLQVRSTIGDSLAKRLIKRFGGLIGAAVTKSWSLIWFGIERAIRLFGMFFFLIFWALLADYLVEHVRDIVDEYALFQGTPRKRVRLARGGSIYRREPGGNPP